jgi:putative oxidoreductase
MNPILSAHCLLVRAASYLQPVVLLLVRLFWGYQFFLAGKGKLENIERPIEGFTKLGIPLPEFNAYLVGWTECLGGLLLVFGLVSRLVSIPLAFAMCVAMATAHRAELFKLFSDSDAFFGAAPLPFLIASLLILAFGPGKISLDYAIDKLFLRNRPQNSL